MRHRSTGRQSLGSIRGTMMRGIRVNGVHRDTQQRITEKSLQLAVISSIDIMFIKLAMLSLTAVAMANVRPCLQGSGKTANPTYT